MALHKHLNFKSFIAKRATEKLFNNLKLEVIKQDADWQSFLDAIKKGEPDLLRKLKGAEKIASMYGCYYAQFELWQDVIKINFAVPNSLRNNYLRLAQGEGFNAVIELLWYKSKGSKLLTIESYTNHDVNRVVLETGTTGLINNDIFVIEAPAYILAHNHTGKYPHNYGVLPVYQFLNRDDVDYCDNELALADWFLGSALLDWLNYFWFKYVADELDLDTTRIIGRVSYQELFGKDSAEEELEMFINNQDAYKNSDWYKARNDAYTAGEKILKKLIINTPGDETKVEKMQSTFNGDNHITTFNKVLSAALEICGYCWKTGDETGNYENQAAILHVNKTEYETTKNKKILRENDWYRFLELIATAYFQKLRGMSLEAAKDKASHIKEYFKFEIISSMLNDYLKGDQRIMDLYSAGLMSKERAVQATSPDLSAEQLKAEIDKIDAQQVQEREFVESSVETAKKVNEGGNTQEPNKVSENA